MRVSMTLEAQDKASRAIRAAQKTVAGFNKVATAGANTTARATAKAANAYSKTEKAARAAGKAAAAGAAQGAAGHSRAQRALAMVARAQDRVAAGARRVGDFSAAAGRAAERAYDRASEALARWARRQGDLIVKGGGMIGQGAGQVWQGMKGAGKVAAGVATGAGVLGIAGGMLMSQLVAPAGEFERFATILTTLQGSAQAAQAALAWISDFAAKTPYDMAGVTDAFVKLRAYGLDPMSGLLKTLGNTSAAMGKPLIQAVEAIADAVTGEFERLKEFGIKGAVDGAYAVFAFTAKDGSQKTIKALKNDRKAIEQALAFIWNNKYAGAMDALSATWEGMVSNLADQWSRIRLMIMNAGLFDWMKGRLGDILSTIDRMTADGSLQAWAKDISTTLIATLSKGWEVAKGLGAALGTLAKGAEQVATAIGGWENFSYLLIAAAFAGPILNIASGLFLIARGAWVAGFALMRVMAVLSLSSTLWAFSAALRGVALAMSLASRGALFLGASLMATPIGWIIAGLAAVAAAAYLIYANWDSIGPWLAEKWEQIRQVFSDAWNWLAALDWPSLMPDWDWSAIIPDISLPSFSWSSLLPDWDWSSIIPSLPDFGSWFGGSKDTSAVTNAQDMAQLARQAEAANKLIAGIGPAAQAAVQAASSALSAASFHSHGVALMETLAAGIRAGAGAAVGAVQGVTQQMRDYLPHSPAKVGPLSDLDRVRFSETLASAIRPGPAAAAARSVAAGMRGALSDIAPRSAGLPIGTAGAGAGGGVTVSVQYSPSVTVPAGTTQQQAASFAQQLRDHADELARMVDEAVRRQKRLEY
ncbi:tape measure protein [Ancylobacter sp. A5.8]|uniref:tape measure protein n=1 Tax=Ancylobacter gelatini TaxID=2919920 RepID=UPI001F4E0120|nr:tape measure protein [Ancylobacter gelatini]MCJ8142971.1 tape measure protein [Ancylobacter gelatini]